MIGKDMSEAGWLRRIRPNEDLLRPILLTVGPIGAALALSGLILALAGVDPFEYYGYVIKRGMLSTLGLEQTATRMAPLLFLAAGLIVAFRAGLWNLGVDGQFLLGAVMAAALAPALITALPAWMTWIVAAAAAALVGAIWSLLPAMLRAFHGVNEIISSLMMTFLGISFCNVMVKLVFLDPGATAPQTRTVPVDDRLPRLFDTTISSGVLFGLVVVLGAHWVMTRTAFGLKLRVVGANARAAAHSGLPVAWLTVAVFAISAALAGLAGAVEILGVHGNLRADWNPAYGLLVIPLVFLARLHGVASVVLVFLYSVLMIGGESAARRLGVPHYFTLVLVANLLIFLALAEFLDLRRRNGARAS